MFSELIASLEDNGKGIHAFRKAAEMARARAAKNSERVAAWSLLARISDLFVERNEREPLPTTECDRWFDLLKAETERLETAFSDGDAGRRLTAINQTAQTLVDQEA